MMTFFDHGASPLTILSRVCTSPTLGSSPNNIFSINLVRPQAIVAGFGNIEFQLLRIKASVARNVWVVRFILQHVSEISAILVDQVNFL